MYFLVMIYLLLTLTALYLTWQGWRYFQRMRLWKKVSAMPFPQVYRGYIEKIPHYHVLPDVLKRKVEHSILFFIETKEFRGVYLEVTDEMRVVIAFYACLMQLGRGECYETLQTILIYPNDVITSRVEANGTIYTRGDFILEGESAGGTVVIAWHEAKREAYHPGGHNVVVHEMAHEIDFEDGSADGIPPLGPSRYYEWTHVMFKTFRKLQNAFTKGRYLDKYRLIGAYAATDEAEFFAVVSELFFEKPLSLRKHFPDVYRELKKFYNLDTAALFGALEA